jgi:heterodisulfide reductase subunit D
MSNSESKSKIKSKNSFTARQLLNIEACTRCGQCTDLCCAYNASNDLWISPAKKMELLRKKVRSGTLFGKLFGRLSFSDKDMDILARAAYECTLCARCEVDCPVNIDLQKLWISLRSSLTDDSRAPQALAMLKERLDKSHNISFDTNEGRAEWISQVADIGENKYVKEKAQVIYFVGCVSSFSPRVFKIPRSIVKIFKTAKVDFGLLGDEEWCCGFPLLSSGFKQDFVEFAKHNIEKVNSAGAKYLVTSCPSCFHMWKHIYHELPLDNVKANFEVLHTVQYIYKLAQDYRLRLKPINQKVTYHDPCDLGRNSGIYDEPRKLIRMIPGITFVELEKNKIDAICCGGGGNVEAVNKQLSESIAQLKAREIIKTGADIVVTSCQQCVRTILQALKKENSKIKTMDISELVLASISGAQA